MPHIGSVHAKGRWEEELCLHNRLYMFPPRFCSMVIHSLLSSSQNVVFFLEAAHSVPSLVAAIAAVISPRSVNLKTDLIS